MLTQRQVATLRAALLYWQEEMCPHGKEVMQPYLEPADIEPLNATETADLRHKLNRNVCYVVYDSARQRLDGVDLFHDVREAELAADGNSLAAVILPGSISLEG